MKLLPGFLALMICLACAPMCGANSARVVLAPPENGVYHSAHPDFGTRDDLVTAERVRAFTALAGKDIVWSYVSFHWDRGIRFPTEQCRVLAGEGVVPLIGFMPWSTLRQGVPETRFTMERLLSGAFDDALRACAGDVRDLGFPIMIEFGPEANGSWFPWSGAWNGRDADEYGEHGCPDGPERFRDAYRRVVAIFRGEGASNVTWVFHVASESAPNLPWNAAKHYYPGDEWVDWVGVSLYGRLRIGEPIKPFDELMSKVYRELAALSPTKPIALLEFAVSDDPHGRDKARWIAEALASVSAGRYPRLKAVSWWNKVYRPNGDRSLLEINSGPESLRAYCEGVRGLQDTPLWRVRQ